MALAVALRNQVPLASLVVIEAPAADILRERKEHQHFQAFRRMTDAYFADYAAGNVEAIAAMIDRLLRRSRYLCLMAAPATRLCSRNHAGQYS